MSAARRVLAEARTQEGALVVVYADTWHDNVLHPRDGHNELATHLDAHPRSSASTPAWPRRHGARPCGPVRHRDLPDPARGGALRAALRRDVHLRGGQHAGDRGAGARGERGRGGPGRALHLARRVPCDAHRGAAERALGPGAGADRACPAVPGDGRARAGRRRGALRHLGGAHARRRRALGAGWRLPRLAGLPARGQLPTRALPAFRRAVACQRTGDRRVRPELLVRLVDRAGARAGEPP